MTEPQRSGDASAAAGVSERDRTARLEELLLSGLDYYFAGHFELAINVWTRVLFLDRGHARARAYIERARSAVSERQREGEELIHTGAAAFQRGESLAARRLLTSGIEHGAGNEEAMVLLERLDRLEAAGVQQETHRDLRPGVIRVAQTATPPIDAGRSRIAWIAAGVVLGVTIAALGITALWGRSGEWLRLGTPDAPAAVTRAVLEPLPLPSRSDVLMARAQGLQAKGRLRDALTVLDSIRPFDAARADADKLRATIQSQLLTAARSGRPTPLQVTSPTQPRR